MSTLCLKTVHKLTFKPNKWKVTVTEERKEYFDSFTALSVSPQVKQYIMNPKAMPRQQLLGQIDMDTREWMDGVLTNSARNVVKEPQGDPS